MIVCVCVCVFRMLFSLVHVLHDDAVFTSTVTLYILYIRLWNSTTKILPNDNHIYCYQILNLHSTVYACNIITCSDESGSGPAGSCLYALTCTNDNIALMDIAL